MIRTFANQRVPAFWFYAALAVLVCGSASASFGPVWALVAAAGGLIAFLVLELAKLVAWEAGIRVRSRLRLRLRLVATTPEEIAACLADLARAGVLRTEASARGRRYIDRAHEPGRARSELHELAETEAGGVRWLPGADEVLDGLYRQVPGVARWSPFRLKPPRTALALDLGRGAVRTQLEALEALGVVSPLATVGGLRLFGVRRPFAPVVVPPYAPGTRLWWDALADEGVVYVRSGDTVALAPRALPELVRAEGVFNAHAEGLLRFHRHATRPPGTVTLPPERRAEPAGPRPTGNAPHLEAPSARSQPEFGKPQAADNPDQDLPATPMVGRRPVRQGGHMTRFQVTKTETYTLELDAAASSAGLSSAEGTPDYEWAQGDGPEYTATRLSG